MSGFFALVLHAHLPFVRHPDHERFLEESWLFEAVVETYLPLVRIMAGWVQAGLQPRLTLSVSPTLCAMLRDPLLQERCARYLATRIELAEKEVYRTHFNRELRPLAEMYLEQFRRLLRTYDTLNRDLVGVLKNFQDRGVLELISCAATHAVLPLLENHPPSLRAQILTGRDHHRACFGTDPVGIWLPECAYTQSLDAILREANLRWFIVDTHGLMQAHPPPRYGVQTPVFTPQGLAAFGRDRDSAEQVWSRNRGYPGDPRYRDFYRDIGFDLDLDYLDPYVPASHLRGATGVKYYRITGPDSAKLVYDRAAALAATQEHARHFLAERRRKFQLPVADLDRPPLVVAPYDAELFGHWWFEGIEFLDAVVRGAWADANVIQMITPTDYLRRYPTNPMTSPSPSSWGEGGYWRVWLNETNAWIQPQLLAAQQCMTELARRFSRPSGVTERALKQAARELLLAQASDWPFILHAQTSAEFARQRVLTHLQRFQDLYAGLTGPGVDEAALAAMEKINNLFPDVDYRHWA